LTHYASRAFWDLYRALPDDVRKSADEAFARLKEDPRHPSLHFKKVGRYRSARVSLHYRALAVAVPDGFVWFWIGSHADYDNLMS
jgi:hypothetical protein